MTWFKFKRDNRKGDDPVISNYDPEKGLPDVKKPFITSGPIVCPTCRGRKKVYGMLPVLNDKNEVTGYQRIKVDCPDCTTT